MHLLVPSSLGTIKLGWGTILGKFMSLRGAIKRRAKVIFWSSGVVEWSVNVESVEFCDKDKDKEDKERAEQVLWSPTG